MRKTRKGFTVALAISVILLLAVLNVKIYSRFHNTQKPEIINQDEVVLPAELVKIAECESGNKHYDDNGEVIRGELNPLDIGKYQINLGYWGDKSKELGYNIHEEEGNTLMALWIYKNYGTDPWNWSKKCWGE